MEKNLFQFLDVKGFVESGREPVYLSDEKWSLGGRLVRAGFVFCALLFLLMIGAVLSRGIFFNPRNIRNIGGQIMPNLLMAAAMIFLFSQGGIDFSFASVGAVSGTVMVLLINAGIPSAAAILAGLFTGLLFGVINGTVAGFLRVPGLIVTLITALAARSINMALLQGRTLTVILSDSTRTGLNVFFKGFGYLVVLGLFALAVLLYFFPRLFSKAQDKKEPGWGLKSFKLGLPYLMTSLVAGFAGMFFTLYIMAATPMQGANGEMDILFVLIFGGVVLGSKAGNPVGVLLAALFLGLFRNVMSIMNLPFYGQILILVFLMIGSLIFNFGYETLTSHLYLRKKSA